MPLKQSAPPRLDGRLGSAVPFVRGGVIADIGTDHAYLPVRLLLDGKVSEALAADINPGPLENAAQTLEKYGLSDKITLLLTDGLRGVLDYSPEDIIIFGMGGELIISIINDEPRVRDRKIRLILQPMTHPELLRAYLLENGFDIVGEALSEADGRIYQTVCAEFDGVRREADSLSLLIGGKNIERGGELLARLVQETKKVFSVRRGGKCASGADTSYEDEILRRLEAISVKVN